MVPVERHPEDGVFARIDNCRQTARAASACWRAVMSRKTPVKMACAVVGTPLAIEQSPPSKCFAVSATWSLGPTFCDPED
jgi:hypothetical protein